MDFTANTPTIDYGANLKVHQRGYATFDVEIDTRPAPGGDRQLSLTITAGPAAEFDLQQVFMQVRDQPTLVAGVTTPGLIVRATSLALTAKSGVVAATPADIEPKANAKVRFWVPWTPNAGSEDISNATLHFELVSADPMMAVETLDLHPLGMAMGGGPRPGIAFSFVLDRSGSMAEDPGAAVGDSQKITTLRRAAFTCANLLFPGLDRIGCVSFDNLIEYPFDAGDVASAPIGTNFDPMAAVPPKLTPRNTTAIGDGIMAGRAQIANDPLTQKAVVLVTDGMENTGTNRLTSLPMSPIKTFAIGVGVDGVSLNSQQLGLAASGGYVLITGPLDDANNAAQRYVLEKFFLHVLADATGTYTGTVVDPSGVLSAGKRQSIPFDLSEVDQSIDAILLTRDPDKLLAVLETPGHELIFPTSTSPHVQYEATSSAIVYRVELPALAADKAGSHVGRWYLHLFNVSGGDIDLAGLASTKKDEALKLLAKLPVPAKKWIATKGGAPASWSFLVHARTSLRLSTKVHASGVSPGSQLTIAASVYEYKALISGARCSVRAEISYPDGTTSTVALAETSAGRYRAQVELDDIGTYLVRVVAAGTTFSGKPFTRESLRTASIRDRVACEGWVPPSEGGPRCDGAPGGGGGKGEGDRCPRCCGHHHHDHGCDHHHRDHDRHCGHHDHHEHHHDRGGCDRCRGDRR